ncbi:hypothetical protein EAH_00044000 [Eimeria acervulina]|uniref:Uncharacterized protein n=1 Tax=Eimeria acervulina TaxID=5801 RepID=U6GU59_EIMAC|nr:hypothetical protein EAH_00044000 [Eimeria acervulina]CDI83801.1 hypothetical protein EAH_00044000 [Eimeria acervulina]
MLLLFAQAVSDPDVAAPGQRNAWLTSCAREFPRGRGFGLAKPTPTRAAESASQARVLITNDFLLHPIIADKSAVVRMGQNVSRTLVQNEYDAKSTGWRAYRMGLPLIHREWVVFFSFDHTLTSLDGPPKLGHALERPSAGLTVTSGRRGHADRLFPPILHKQAVFVWSQLRCDSRVPRAISQEPLVYLEAAYAADDEFLHGFRHHICAGLDTPSAAIDLREEALDFGWSSSTQRSRIMLK